MKKSGWIKEVWQGLTKTGQLITISLGAILISSLLKGLAFISWIQCGLAVTIILVALVLYMYFTRNK